MSTSPSLQKQSRHVGNHEARLPFPSPFDKILQWVSKLVALAKCKYVMSLWTCDTWYILAPLETNGRADGSQKSLPWECESVTPDAYCSGTLRTHLCALQMRVFICIVVIVQAKQNTRNIIVFGFKIHSKHACLLSSQTPRYNDDVGRIITKCRAKCSSLIQNWNQASRLLWNISYTSKLAVDSLCPHHLHMEKKCLISNISRGASVYLI